MIKTALCFAALAGTLLASGPTGGGGGGGACSAISSFSVSSSYSPYGSTLADVKVSYTLKACTPTFNPQTTVTVTYADTGVVAWSYVFGGLKVTTPPYGNLPVNTNFRVDMSVADYSTGQVVDTRTALTTTPKGKAQGTGI